MKYKYSDDKYTVSFKECSKTMMGIAPVILIAVVLNLTLVRIPENTKKGETCACGLYVKVKIK